MLGSNSRGRVESSQADKAELPRGRSGFRWVL